jgi:hypothetical protein
MTCGVGKLAMVGDLDLASLHTLHSSLHASIGLHDLPHWAQLAYQGLADSAIAPPTPGRCHNRHDNTHDYTHDIYHRITIIDTIIQNNYTNDAYTPILFYVIRPQCALTSGSPAGPPFAS